MSIELEDFLLLQYVCDYVTVNGLQYPTKRRAYMRAMNGQPLMDRLMASMGFFSFWSFNQNE
jgi:hypothetical protein